MNTKRLIEILSIPSYYGMEFLVQDYLIKHGNDKGYKVHQDEKGNVYFEKGNVKAEEHFPCVCAHTDTVFEEHVELIQEGLNKDVKFGKKKTNKNHLFAYLPGTDTRTGLGGDDLAGVSICLEMMESFPTIKAAFFVEEEFGCHGSAECDDNFFENVAYAIQFDGPTGNWYTKTLSGVKMYNDEFHQQVKPLLEKHNVTNYSDDPYTDILNLKEKYDFACCNLPSGYHNWHTKDEYVNVDHVEKGIKLGKSFINKLGLKKQVYDDTHYGVYLDFD